MPEKQFVWTKVTQDDLARHDVTFEEVEGLIDVVRRTREAEVSCVLKEAADGTWRVSLRSLGAVDVRRIAEQRGRRRSPVRRRLHERRPAEAIVDAIVAAS